MLRLIMSPDWEIEAVEKKPIKVVFNSKDDRNNALKCSGKLTQTVFNTRKTERLF